MKLEPVLSKGQFVERYMKSEFGNRSPSWDTLEEFLEHGNRADLYHIRTRVANGPTWYNVPVYEVRTRWLDLLENGTPESSLYISAMCPTEKTIFQGEIYESDTGLQLFGSRIVAPMRVALQQGVCYNELLALMILRQVMNERSYGWFEYLREAYPGHVMEFTALSRCWGTCPGENVLWWEVRQY